MAHNLEFVARLRAPLSAALLLAFAACNENEPLSPESGTPAEPGVEVVQVDAPSLATTAFAGGIAFGNFGQPASAFGTYYNGAKMTVSPGGLLDYLAAVKSRGGKVVLMLAGPDYYYKDSRGFNLSKWKARVDRFKYVNFSKYVTDGTVIGHYMLDEPHNTKRWNGHTVSPSTLDEMARYSKARWSNMATIVRGWPNWFKTAPKYLDAAWAMYAMRKGPIGDFIRQNVADAQRVGLALVVGLNVTKGGPDRRRLTASEVKTYGSGLLTSSYPCAFISWEYTSYVSTSDMSTAMKDAMRTLRSKAQSRSTKSCRS